MKKETLEEKAIKNGKIQQNLTAKNKKKSTKKNFENKKIRKKLIKE